MLAARKKRFLIAAGFILAVVSAAFVFKRSTEGPDYQGRTLETWIARYYATTRPNDFIDNDTKAADAARAKAAIENIGTNGIPYLLKWMDYKVPRQGMRKKTYERLGAFFDYIGVNLEIEDTEWIRAEAAMLALQLLGPKASVAAPHLAAKFEIESPDDFSAGRAGRVLVMLGESGTKVFIDGLSHKNREVRYFAAARLGEMGKHARPAIPVLIETLNDAEPIVSLTSAATLGILGLEPDLCVPALIKNFQTSKKDSGKQNHAAVALGNFGTNAISAVPLLLETLKESNDESFILTLTNALQKIAPEIYIDYKK